MLIEYEQFAESCITMIFSSCDILLIGNVEAELDFQAMTFNHMNFLCLSTGINFTIPAVTLKYIENYV